MYKLCMTEQSAARQRELEAGLLSLMAVKRYEEITVSDMCEFLKIPRKAFYRYFSGKEGALQALLDHTLMEYESFADNQSVELRSAQGDLERFFRFWLHHRPLMDVLERNALTPVLIQRCMTTALSGSTIPQRFLTQESPDGRKTVIMFAVCGLMTMVVEWHHSGYPHSPTHMSKLAVRALSQPLFPNIAELL